VMSLGGRGLAAETKPEGEMRFALYVTVAPAWLDPGEAVLGPVEIQRELMMAAAR
jgi:hypothetical protein